jgi:RNA polymerase sigma factor (sigma-70 family)
LAGLFPKGGPGVCRDMTGPLALTGSEDPLPRMGGLPPFEEVYARNASSVYRFCMSQVADAELAADLTHDAFVKAFAAYERVRPDSASIRTWLVSIARNCCIDRHRRNGRWLLLVRHLQQSRDRPVDVESLVEERAELRRVSAAVGTLSARDRELIGLRVAADLSYREVADVLGLSEQAAKVATFRALKKLRSKLEDSHDRRND